MISKVAIAALLIINGVKAEHWKKDPEYLKLTNGNNAATKEELEAAKKKWEASQKPKLERIAQEEQDTCTKNVDQWEKIKFMEKFKTYDECFQLINTGEFSEICHDTNTQTYYCCNPLPNIDLGWGEGQNDLQKYKNYKNDPNCLDYNHDDGCSTLDQYTKNSFMDIYLSKTLQDYENSMCALNNYQATVKENVWVEYQRECTTTKNQCFKAMQMHQGLEYFLGAKSDDGWLNGTVEKCQEDTSKIFGEKDDKFSTKGAQRGEQIGHQPRTYPNVTSHFDKQTVISEMYDPNNKKDKIKANACKWTIYNDFKYKFLRLQDLKIKFKELKNVKVYITSYFRDDKLSTTSYFLDDASVQKLVNNHTEKPMTIEMYNTTHIYIVPDEKVKKADTYYAEFEFYVQQVQEFLYGQKYNAISVYISGYGGIIMIFSVVFYLGGFTKLYNYLKTEFKERQRRIKEDQLLRQSEAAGEGDAAKAGANDTAKNMEELSDDDLNFGGNGALKDDAAVHEGGRQSRPGSMEQGARKNMIKKSQIEQY